MVRRSDPPGADRGDDSKLTYRRLLGHRLYVHCWVRAAVAVTIVVAGWFAGHVLGIEGIDLRALFFLALGIAIYNAVAWALFSRFRDPETPALYYEGVVRATYGVVVLDFLALTAAVWLVGGCRSPFVAFYLLHVIVSAILLSRRGALALMGLAYALLVLLVLGEWSGVAPPRLPEGAIAGAGPLEGRYALTILVVYGMLFGLTSFLLLGLTRALRRGESRMQLANAEMARLSEQRRDFLHIAMHNLKAPLAAVSMFLDNLREGLAGPVNQEQREILDRSLRRLGSLSEFMADMQTLSSLETEIIAAEFQRVNLAGILESLVEEYRDVADEQHHELRFVVRRPVPRVVGHERLLREAAVNYVTNAIKYTPDGGHIEVRLFAKGAHVRVEVADDGEGIPLGDQRRLFGEFVRVLRPGSQGPGDKGSGLGLSIVKRIVLAHGGSVGVDSEEGRGSTFWIELPPLRE